MVGWIGRYLGGMRVIKYGVEDRLLRAVKAFKNSTAVVRVHDMEGESFRNKVQGTRTGELDGMAWRVVMHAETELFVAIYIIFFCYLQLIDCFCLILKCSHYYLQVMVLKMHSCLLRRW